MIQEDRHCMPTSDYYFTNIQPDPIVIPPHSENNSGSTSQQAAAKDQIPQQTDILHNPISCNCAIIHVVHL